MPRPVTRPMRVFVPSAAVPNGGAAVRPSNGPDTHGKEFERVFGERQLTLGVYRCNHRNQAIGAEQVTRRFSVNFPIHGMYVKHLGRRKVVVDPNHVVFFNAEEVYRTSHPDGCGDYGTYICVAPELLMEVVGEVDPTVEDRADHPFDRTHGPLSAALFRAQRDLYEEVARGDVDELAVEERLLEILRGALVGSFARGRRSAATGAASHRDLAQAAAEVVASRYRQSWRLDDLAAELGVSTPHLCRVFKQQTGESLHAYRDRLRLREAFRLLADPAVELTEIALRLGYSSHSHFTARFRREFGVAPNDLRSRRRVRSRS